MATRKMHVELPAEIAVEPAEHGQAEELRRAISVLPATQRGALVLRELEGRSYAEIAQSLDLSVSAVETLIFRARRALREQIENAMSCDEFVALLDDPSARVRIRAHARVCADCATLDHQYRGRKSVLKRIASVFGLPWWGAKVAAVALTAGAVAVVAVPHHASTPTHSKVNLIPRVTQPNLVSQAGGTRFKSLAPKHHPVAAAPKVSGTRPQAPAVSIAVPPAPRPDPKPGDPPLPPAAALPQPPVAVPSPTLTDPQTVLPSVSEPPTVTLPTISLPVQTPALPTVTIAVETAKVSLP